VHRGIAVVDSYGSYTAAAVELSVTKDKQIDVKRVAVALDSGHVVHPDAVKAQIEGGVLWGLSAIMSEEITIENGAVKQSNFHDYPLARINVKPEIIPVLMPSGGFWGGVGEPPIGGVIPAMVNALFSATGQRIRSLPLKHHGFKYKV
jgi:isoquinoline 1-oxidoreductase beta subunit